MESPVPAFTSTFRSVVQKGEASSTCTASSSKNVPARRKVRSMTWSGMTSVFGAISSRRLPTAPVARMCVTPSDFSAQMLARYGTCDGLRRCPSPCRARSATVLDPVELGDRDGPGGSAEGRLDLADLAGAEGAERLAEPRTADHPDDDARHRDPPRSRDEKRGVYRAGRRGRASPNCGVHQMKKPAGACGAGGRKKCGSDLLSHTASRAVPSALVGLTSVFGMGTGVTPSI